MQIELTLHESDYVRHLLDTARRALLHELRHVHGDEFKDALAHQLELNETLVRKIEPVPTTAHQGPGEPPRSYAPGVNCERS